MKTNNQIVRDLMTQQATLNHVCRNLEKAHVTVGALDDVNLFDIVLDLIGFPKETRLLRQTLPSGDEIDRKSRSKWTIAARQLKWEDIDAFIDKLYAEYNELFSEQPELFAVNIKEPRS